MNLRYKIITLVMMIITIIACSYSVCSAATYDVDRITIYIAGDSLMAGVGNTSPDTSLYKTTFKKTYTRIEKESNKKCAGVGFYLKTSCNRTLDKKGNITATSDIYDTLVENKIYCTQKRDYSKGGAFICGSICGSQTTAMIKQMKADKKAYTKSGIKNRTVVLINGATNDIYKKTSSCKSRLISEKYQISHAKKMIACMKKVIAVDPNAKFIYILPTHISDYVGNYKSSFDGYEAYLRAYVKEDESLNGHVEYISIAKYIPNSTTYIQKDKLHLKSISYRILVDRILKSNFMKRHEI